MKVWIGAAVVAAVAGGAVSIKPSYGAGVAAVFVAISALMLSRNRPLGETLILLMVALSGLINLPQRIPAGATTGQGVVDVLCVGAVFLILVVGKGAYGIPRTGPVLLLMTFTVWSVVTLTWDHITQGGAQNVLVFLSFAGMLCIGASSAKWRPKETYWALGTGFNIASVTCLSIYAAGILAYGRTAHGQNVFLQARPFALFGTLLVAWYMAAHLAGSRWAKWFVIATVALSFLSLSRSATAVQLALIVIAKMDGRTLKRTIGSIALVAGVLLAGFAAVEFYKPLHDRFFTGDVVKIGPVAINVSGRLGLWAPNWDAFKKDWLFGNGAGTSDRITAALPHHGATQPHCDYLRLLVDYGLVGALVWLAAFIGLALGAWYAWRPLRGTHSMGEHVHAAAFLGIMGMMGGMLVDNPLIEFSKMASLGALVGVSVALQLAAAQQRAKEAEPATAFPLLEEAGVT